MARESKAEREDRLAQEAELNGTVEGIEGKTADVENEQEELVKVAVLAPRTIINSHVLAVGTVIKMTQADIDKHRSAGVPLEDVAEDDEREVFDVQTTYEAKGDEEEAVEEQDE